MGRDEDFRVRLEGGAEVLEVAAVRYRALNGILDSLRWRARLAENVELLDAIREAHAEVLAALGSAKRLLKVGPSRELRRLTEKTEALVERTQAQVTERAGDASDFTEALKQLKDEVAPTPGVDSKRWREARLALPTRDPKLSRLRALTEEVHDFAHRPPPPRVGPPWPDKEVPKVIASLAALDELCADLWRRLSPEVEQVLLQALARPKELSDDGPSQLVRAEPARRVLRARIKATVEAVFAPLEPSPHECPELLRWLSSDEEMPKLLPASRAKLFALAARLTAGPAKSAAQWERLMSLSTGVSEDSDDARALLENLTLYLRIQQQKKGARRQNPKTLSESLLMLRALSS